MKRDRGKQSNVEHVCSWLCFSTSFQMISKRFPPGCVSQFLSRWCLFFPCPFFLGCLFLFFHFLATWLRYSVGPSSRNSRRRLQSSFSGTAGRPQPQRRKLSGVLYRSTWCRNDCQNVQSVNVSGTWGGVNVLQSVRIQKPTTEDAQCKPLPHALPCWFAGRSLCCGTPPRRRAAGYAS